MCHLQQRKYPLFMWNGGQLNYFSVSQRKNLPLINTRYAPHRVYTDTGLSCHLCICFVVPKQVDYAHLRMVMPVFKGKSKRNVLLLFTATLFIVTSSAFSTDYVHILHKKRAKWHCKTRIFDEKNVSKILEFNWLWIITTYYLYLSVWCKPLSFRCYIGLSSIIVQFSDLLIYSLQYVYTLFTAYTCIIHKP